MFLNAKINKKDETVISLIINTFKALTLLTWLLKTTSANRIKNWKLKKQNSCNEFLFNSVAISRSPLMILLNALVTPQVGQETPYFCS